MYAGDVRDWPKRVRFGRGSIRALPNLLADLGARRAAVICGRSVAGGEMLERVKSALGPNYAGVFAGVRAHTPFEDVREAARIVRSLDADAVITVGGGSAIDAGKGVVLSSAVGGSGEGASFIQRLAHYAIDWGASGTMERNPLRAASIRHIAVPTTTGSASEVMPTSAIRDPMFRRKLLFWDERLVPDATILDPEMAVFAGPELTAATGMTVLARAIESLYSKHRHPISTGLALHAARILRTALPRSVAQPDDLDARADCQMACLMSGTASINAMVSVVHAIGHVVGGRYGLQHGMSHAILLAPALRRLCSHLGADKAWVLEALGCGAQESIDAAAGAVHALLQRLPLPQRLRETGVEENEIGDIAAGTMDDYMMANCPAPLALADVEALLREAW